ncbi:MAG: type IV secretion protein IcmD [Legionellaceae bacterium]|nr:type IV secretion protein IcmD [Legionellaceae bacterium]MBP9774548.1 type IV secretion protein IcmD [Legionellaceae bacterium]
MKKIKHTKVALKGTMLVTSLMAFVWADVALAESLGTMASTLTKTFGSVGKAVTALSYIAGLGFAIASILQFKQHKENPSQTPIGKPVSQILIAAGLLFLPSMFSAVGNTIFKDGGKTAGASGTEINSSTGS